MHERPQARATNHPAGTDGPTPRGNDSTEDLAKAAGDDFVYRNHVNAAIDQLRLALRTADTGERIRLLTGALANTGNAIGQLAQFDSDGRARPPRK